MRHIIVLASSITIVHADLTCLTWGAFVTVVGLFCHFRHDEFNAAENATINAITSYKDNLKDVANFAVTHHPVNLTYNYIKASNANGATAAIGQLAGEVKDIVRMDIGFGEDLANQAVTIVDLAYWGDLSFCLMSGAVQAVNESSPATLAASPLLPGTGSPDLPLNLVPRNAAASQVTQPALSLQAGKDVITRCMGEKFQRIAKAKAFNITGPNEKVGETVSRTISQVASLFVPVGAEEATGKLAVNAFDLAIPGTEDAGCIFKLVGKDEATHFASEEESLAVRDSLEDDSWIDKNCATCTTPDSANSVMVDFRRSRRGLKIRRGGMLSLFPCCRVPPKTDEGSFTPVNVFGHFEPSSTDSVPVSAEGTAFFDTTQYADSKIPESALTLSPPYTLNTDVKDDAAHILQDLQMYNTAILTWTPKLIKVMDSRVIFRTLRQVFNAATPELQGSYDSFMQYVGSQRQFFMGTDTGFLECQVRAVRKIRAFNTAMEKEVKAAVAEIKSLSDEDAAALRIQVKYDYHKPDTARLRSPDPRGLRMEEGIMEFVASNEVGMVVQYEGTKLTRVPIGPNQWQLLRGAQWNNLPDAESASRVTTFGPEMASNGRISINVVVFGN